MKKHVTGMRAALMALVVLAWPVALWAGKMPVAGVVVMASGEAKATSIDQAVRPLARRSDILVGDKLVTGADGNLQVRMKDGALVVLGPDAQFIIKAYSDDAAGDKKDEAVLSLVQGGLRTISGSIEKSAYRLETPVATLGIRGTVFDVYVKGDGTTVVVLRDGAVDVTGEGGGLQKMDIPGLATIIEPGKAPSKPGPVPPEVLDYLKKMLGEVPDNVTWQTNEDGSTTINVGDDVINIMNTPPPGIEGDGDVPGQMVEETQPGCAPTDMSCMCAINPYMCY